MRAHLVTCCLLLAACGGSSPSTSPPPPPPVVRARSVSISPESVSVAQGATVTLTATVRDSAGQVLTGRMITWWSPEPGRAPVSSAGVVNGVAAVDAIIRATADSAVGQAQISVIGPVASIVVSPAAPTLVIGDSLQFTATPRDAAGHARADRPVSWGHAGIRIVLSAAGRATGAIAGVDTLTAIADQTSASVPVAVVMDSTVSRLAAGSGKTCAVTGPGTVYCWGMIAYAVPGIGTGDPPAVVRAAVRLPGAPAAADVSVGGAHACLLTSAGAAWCWGANQDGQLGNSSVTGICGAIGLPCSTVPVAVDGGHAFTTIAAREYHTCAVGVGGEAYCWGRGTDGQLGNDASQSSPAPVPVAGGVTFTALALGQRHSCGLGADSLAYCWGTNEDGQLGIGSTDPTPHGRPVAVAGGRTFVAIAATLFGVCAATPAGEVYCWGRSAVGIEGALPDSCASSFRCATAPVPVTGLSGVRSVTAGDWHACAIVDDGGAWCWGDGTFGQLGTGTAWSYPAPAAVAGGTLWQSLTAGMQHTCGLSTGGAAYCWGGNGDGALGTGVSADATLPTRVLGQR